MSVTEFAESTYRIYDKHYADFEPGGARAADSECWFDQGSVDAWRHRRMYAAIDPLLDHFPAATWLTIGDGRCGSDAQYIKSRGRRALATDIATGLLEVAHERGAIDDFARENAEQLSFDDDSFDFVLCKESYHHFPRPMLALYEMLRVARKAVILIEPHDRFFHSPFPEWMQNAIKRFGRALIGKRNAPARFQFESVGNFIYTISRRELEKVAAGLNLGPVAFKGLNDCFVDGVGHARAVEGDPLFAKVQKELRRLDFLCRLRLRQPRLLAAILFKADLDPSLRNVLDERGFDIPHRPANPYLAA